MTSSWDKTARVWLNEKSVTTLKGHEGAVWCGVILPNVGIMVTGSADYSLRLWKGGQCKKKITGIHTQAVRGRYCYDFSILHNVYFNFKTRIIFYIVILYW